MNISEKDRLAATRAVLRGVALDRKRRRLLRVGETVQHLADGVVSTVASVDVVARTVTLEGQTEAIPWDTVHWVNKTRLEHLRATFEKKA